jgi:adenosylcobyric acid synthase
MRSMTARPFFVGGTASHAGKSWMATALCAWLRRRGVRVAPFKAQNMSNNSFPCAAGGEIGRAQVAQAEACGLAPEPAMNPILLKPNGDGTSQVVVNGLVWKTLTARDYYAHTAELRGVVRSAYENLARRFDVVVIEGAGSVTEMNLRPYDLVNLDLVTRLDAPWMLVADIERGGVFGSVIGTFGLLTADERRLCRGFAINRFRGDPSLFEDGVRLIEARTGAPCLGVFPHASDIHLDAEDSLSIQPQKQSTAPDRATLAVIRLPSVSNTTDFRLLTWADWVSAPPPADYDFVVLPGAKHVIADLEWLHASGLAAWIQAQHRRGATIVGICGGYQMLGRSISDPTGAESPRLRAQGLGLIPAETVLGCEKTTRVVNATTGRGVSFSAYEIHLGETTIDREEGLEPFAYLDTGAPDGARAAGVIGTYLHGALEHPAVCAEVFGVPVSAMPSAQRDYDRLADWFAAHARQPESLGLDRRDGEGN